MNTYPFFVFSNRYILKNNKIVHMINKLMKLLKIKFAGELVLKDGTSIICDGNLEVGVSVSVNSPDGIIPLPSGSYELETGEVITVENGVITDIQDAVETPEVETPETPDTISGVPAGDKPEVEVEVDAVDTKGTTTETIPNPDHQKMIEDLIAKIDEMDAKIKELEAKTTDLSKESETFNTDLNLIKTKANFVKEIPKNSTHDESPVSPLVQKINKFRELKK